MSNSNQSQPSSSSPALPPTKAIASLAKKPNDVTRQGAQKLKFVPTLPARRKKDDIKTEPTTSAALPQPSSDPVRGLGRGDGRGRGRGALRPQVVDMTASGPFALGPATAGSSARRPPPRSNFAPTVPASVGSSAQLSANLTPVSASGIKQEVSLKGKGKETKELPDEDQEVYSDPDDGVEIIDMDHVRHMDWMAPETLRKERQSGRNVKQESTLETEDVIDAVHLSESEEEQEIEEMMEDFSIKADADTDTSLREERLYFFQFPSPFPSFIPGTTIQTAESAEPIQIPTPIEGKRVTFTPDTKSASVSDTGEVAPVVADGQEIHLNDTKIDGVIGQLELYRGGIVKMRLANGILLDVQLATQPSFLQHAIHLDQQEKRLVVLGEVNKRFVVSPNVEALLNSLSNDKNSSPEESTN